MKFMFQVNSEGRFRIALETDDGDMVFGDWIANYSSLATLTHEGKTYIAGTTYGLLPHSETVYEVAAQPTIVEPEPDATEAEDANDPFILTLSKRTDLAGVDAGWASPSHPDD